MSNYTPPFYIGVINYQCPKYDAGLPKLFSKGVPYFVSLADTLSLSGEPDYFGRNEISSGGDLSHYSSASLY